MDASAIVFHDYFGIRGGGERLALILASALYAPIVYGYRTGDSYEQELFPREEHDLGLPHALRASGTRALALAWLFSRQRPLACRHRARIFSGVTAPFGAPPRQAPGRNIFYCHTPPRFLFDKREQFLDSLTRTRRLAALPALNWFEAAYRQSISRMHVIVANSENTRRRIAHYLGRESVVVFPPIKTESFRWHGQGNFFLSTARLSSLKRVDVVIEAFRQLPGHQLVIASGGSELAKLQRQAIDLQNVHFAGWVNEEHLRRLLGEAIATIYVPHDEDFGMSPVESMSAGKPVIGVAEGGLLESIVDGQTGTLLAPDFAASDLASAIRHMTPRRALSMRANCEQRAEHFAAERFAQQMLAIIDDT